MGHGSDPHLRRAALPASAPARPVQRRGGAHWLYDRLRDLPVARGHRRQAPWSAPAPFGVALRRHLRTLRRADAGRGGERVSVNGWAVCFHSRSLGAPRRLFIRLVRAAPYPRRIARRHLDDLRRIPLSRDGARAERRAVCDVRALGGRARDRADGDVQLRRVEVGLAGAESDDGGQVWGAAVHHSRRDLARAAANRRALHPRGAARELLDGALRPGADLRALGVRWMGGRESRRRRGEGRPAHAAARDYHRHGRGHRDLRTREFRVSVGARCGDDSSFASRRGGCGLQGDRRAGSRLRGRDGDAVDVRHAQRLDHDGAKNLLCDGGRQVALQADRGGASALPDAVCRDRAECRDRRRVRIDAGLRAAC